MAIEQANTILNMLAKENYISYSKPIARKLGIDEAILFGELCSINYMFGEGEFFYEQGKLMNDTCLTEYSLRNALKNLQNCGLVSIIKKGMPAKNYYLLNAEILLSIMGDDKNVQRTSGVKFDTTSGVKFDTTSGVKFDTTSGVKFDTTFNKKEINKKEINKKEINKKELSPLSRSTMVSDRKIQFNRFWEFYPKKIGKGNCEKWFNTHNPTKDLVDTMITAIEKQKNSKQWKDNKGQYIPYPYTWLNGKRWEDDDTSNDLRTQIEQKLRSDADW